MLIEIKVGAIEERFVGSFWVVLMKKNLKKEKIVLLTKQADKKRLFYHYRAVSLTKTHEQSQASFHARDDRFFTTTTKQCNL